MRGRANGVALAVLASALAAVVLAWVVTNLLDAPVRPRPAALRADASPLPRGEGVAALLALEPNAPPSAISGPDCGPTAACADTERKADAAGGAPEAARPAWGLRCDTLLDSSWRYREAAPGAAPVPAPPATMRPAWACLRWFQQAAGLELHRGDVPAAARALQRAQRLAQQLRAGSDSLLAVTQAWRLTTAADEALVALVLREPALAPALWPVLRQAPEPADEAAQAARRWIAEESALGAAQAEALAGPGCYRGGWLPPRCWAHLGYQPQRTQQAFDDRWWATWQALDRGWWPGVQSLARRPAAGRDPEVATHGGFGGLRWRNPSGAVLLQVSEGSYTSAWSKQADAVLHREATCLVLALQAERVPAAQRPAWAARQAMSDALRSRLNWSADGQALRVPGWSPAPDGQPGTAFEARWPS